MKQKFKFLVTFLSLLVVMFYLFSLKINISAYENIVLSSSDFNEESILIDPETSTGTGNFGGILHLKATVPMANTDALAIRIKNLTDVAYDINTLYLQGTNNFSYSLMKSTIKFVSINGQISTFVSGEGGRNTKIPANFDGLMVIDYNQLVCIKKGGSSYYWTSKTDDFKLLKGSTDDSLNYPSVDLSYLSIYFNKVAQNALENELLLSDVYTLTYDNDEVNYTKYPNSFKIEDNTLEAQNIKLSNYPITKAKYTFEINSIVGTYDSSINLNISDNYYELGYGYSLELNYTLLNNSVLSAILLDGSPQTVIKNMNKEESTHIVNFITISPYQYTIDGDTIISLENMDGIYVDVNNSLGETINYQFIMKGTDNTTYTASSSGNGIFIKDDGINYYGNVFSIPVDFTGKIFIPFNVEAKGAYGVVNNLCFDKNKPSEVLSTIALSYLTTDIITKEALETVFSNWQFGQKPVLSVPTDVNLEQSLIGGMTFKLDNDWLNNFNPVPYVFVEPKQIISLDNYGLAFRIKNSSDTNITLRAYLNGSNNAIYVPVVNVRYTLVSLTNEVEYKLDKNNRNMVIPADFDGTLIINLNDYVTDNLSVVKGSNVVRENINLSGIRFYINAYEDANLLIGKNIGVLNYENEVTLFDEITLDNTTSFSITNNNVKITPIINSIQENNLEVIHNLDSIEGIIEINKTKLLIGDVLMIKTLGDYLITSINLNDVELVRSEDDYYYYLIEENADLVLELSIVEKVSLVFEYDKDYVVLSHDEENKYFNKGVEVSFSLSSVTGYEIILVKNGDTILTGVDGVYTILLNESASILINHQAIVYNITYVLDDGVNSLTNVDNYTIEDQFVLTEATKEGYTFKRWYTIDENNQKVDVLRINKGTTGNKTFYAEFEKINEIVDPKPTPKKGCVGKEYVSFTSLLLIASMFYLVVRRKKY